MKILIVNLIVSLKNKDKNNEAYFYSAFFSSSIQIFKIDSQYNNYNMLCNSYRI